MPRGINAPFGSPDVKIIKCINIIMQYSEFFGKRKNTFEQSLAIIKSRLREDKLYNIVELGTSRSFVDGDIEGCMSTNTDYWFPNNPEKWDWGAGIFTKVFSENLKNENVMLHTVDPKDEAIQIVSVMCADCSNVDVIQNHSTSFLKSVPYKIDFLYMDYVEVSEDATEEHLVDVKLIVQLDLMSEDGVILIDDVGDNISTHTPGKYIIPYLLQNGYQQIAHEHQVLLIRNSPPNN